jgi:hypothetical protein
MNPPTAPYPCTLQGPTWSWVVGTVEQASNPNGPWTSASSGYSIWINQPSSSSPNATIYATFTVAAFWRFTATATATYTDSPCTDIWSASGTTADIYVTAVDVSFSPNPVFACVNCSPASLTATVTPAAAASLVTFTTADSTVATVSGTAPNLSVTGVGTGTTQVQAQLNGRTGKTVPVYVGRAYLTAYRAGDYFGQAVSDTIKQGGDPRNYVLLTDNSVDSDEQAVALAKIVLKGMTPAPQQGVYSISVSNPSAVQLYKADGVTPLASSDWSVDLANPSGYLAGIASGDVTIWVKGVSTEPNLVFECIYSKPDGTQVCMDSVHIDVAQYTLRGSTDSVIDLVSLAPMENVQIFAGVVNDPRPSFDTPYKPSRRDPDAIEDSTNYRLHIDALPTSAVTELRVTSDSTGDYYLDDFASGSSVVSNALGVVYDAASTDFITRTAQTSVVRSVLGLNVIHCGGTKVVLTTLKDKYTRRLHTAVLDVPSTATKYGGRSLITYTSSTTVSLQSSNSTPTGGTTSWQILSQPPSATVSTSGSSSSTFTFTTDSVGGYYVQMTYTYNSTTTVTKLMVYVVPSPPSPGAPGS